MFTSVKEIMHAFYDPIFQIVSPETALFLIIISAFTFQFHYKFNAKTVYSAPAVLTTLGILGTFVGIALGLSNFNVNDVQHSVPELIDGIKTAVWASAWGVFCALTVKIREIMFGIPVSANTGDAHATINDLVVMLGAIQNALTGDDPATLLNHMQLLHKENIAHLAQLNKTLEEFCGNMSTGQSEVLVDALKNVVGDFNHKVGQQFGGNLKELGNEIKATNAENKDMVLDAINAYNAEFQSRIDVSVEKAKEQLAVLEGEQAKIIDKQGKEFAALSQNLARMIRQIHNDSMLSIK